jgi:hypothetical protein
MFITGVNDTGEKLFSGVNNTGEKFIAGVISPYHEFSVIAGVVDIGDKFIVDTGDKLSAVTTTPAINLSPVSRTRTPWRWGAAKDRRKLKGINRRYLRPPKSATAADDVIGTAMKSCIHTHPTHLDQRPLRPLKLNNAVLVCSSFGGLRRGLRACEGPLRLFVAVPIKISVAVADFVGCGRLRRPELVLQKAHTSVVIGGVADTGEQFITGVVDTGQK